MKIQMAMKIIVWTLYILEYMFCSLTPNVASSI